MATWPTFFDAVVVNATESSGHGPFMLGAAILGFQTAASAGIANGTLVSYRATDGINWETAHGVVDVSGSVYTLTRGVDTITSSNGNSLVSFGSGVVVFISQLSQDLNTLLSAGAAQSFSSGQQAQARANIGAPIKPQLDFFAYLSANVSTNTTLAGNVSLIPFDTIVDDTQSAWTGSTSYKWTPTKAGLYLITMSATLLSVTGGQCAPWIYKNGSATIYNQQNTPAANSPSVALSNILAMNGSTDYLQFGAIASGGTIYGGTSSQGSLFTQASISLIGG